LEVAQIVLCNIFGLPWTGSKVTPIQGKIEDLPGHHLSHLGGLVAGGWNARARASGAASRMPPLHSVRLYTRSGPSKGLCPRVKHHQVRGRRSGAGANTGATDPTRCTAGEGEQSEAWHFSKVCERKEQLFLATAVSEWPFGFSADTGGGHWASGAGNLILFFITLTWCAPRRPRLERGPQVREISAGGGPAWGRGCRRDRGRRHGKICRTSERCHGQMCQCRPCMG
jgi:hypothetical protein